MLRLQGRCQYCAQDYPAPMPELGSEVIPSIGLPPTHSQMSALHTDLEEGTCVPPSTVVLEPCEENAH